MCRVADWDPCEVYTETWRKARKTHCCYECGYTIGAGEKYVVVFTIFEGEPGSYKVCWFCHTMSKALTAAQRFHCGESWGFLLGALWDEVREFYDEHKDELGKPYVPPERVPRGDVVMDWGD